MAKKKTPHKTAKTKPTTKRKTNQKRKKTPPMDLLRGIAKTLEPQAGKHKKRVYDFTRGEFHKYIKSLKDGTVRFSAAANCVGAYGELEKAVARDNMKKAVEMAFWMGFYFGHNWYGPGASKNTARLLDLRTKTWHGSNPKTLTVRPEVTCREAQKIWDANPDKNITWVRHKTAKVLTGVLANCQSIKLKKNRRISYWTVMKHTKGKNKLKPPRRKK